jgi:hypothetical protein
MGPSKLAETPKEAYAAGKVEEHRQALGLSFPVYTYFSSRQKDGSNAWASPNAVWFYRGWVAENAEIDISFTAAHEVCHIAGIRDEDAATDCARRLHENA